MCSSEIEDVNWKEFNMTEGINESRALTNIFLVSVDIDLMVQNITQDENETKVSVSMNVKKIAHMKRTIPVILVHVLASVKKIVILVNTQKTIHKSLKNFVNDLVVTCDKVENTPNSAPINLSDRIIYWLIAFVLLVTSFLPLFVVMVGEYSMKCKLNNSIFITILV